MGAQDQRVAPSMNCAAQNWLKNSDSVTELKRAPCRNITATHTGTDEKQLSNSVRGATKQCRGKVIVAQSGAQTRSKAPARATTGEEPRCSHDDKAPHVVRTAELVVVQVDVPLRPKPFRHTKDYHAHADVVQHSGCELPATIGLQVAPVPVQGEAVRDRNKLPRCRRDGVHAAGPQLCQGPRGCHCFETT